MARDKRPLGPEYYDDLRTNSRFNPDVRNRVDSMIVRYLPKLFGELELDVDNSIQPNSSYILGSNHRTFLDIFYVDLASIRMAINPIRPVMKQHFVDAYYSKWLLHAMGGVGVGRGQGNDAELLLDYLENTIIDEDNHSPMFFFEGSRNKDQNPRTMKGMKPGAFELAFRTGKQIIPLVLAGTGKHDKRSSRVPIVGVASEPLDPMRFTHYDNPVKAMISSAEEIMNDNLANSYTKRDEYLNLSENHR